MSDRWQMYTNAPAKVAGGWSMEHVVASSRLGGANGMTFGPDGRLYVTQVFGSQVTAIDIASGAHQVYSPLGGGIVGPDDAIFGADGTFYATEPLFGRVTARNPDGSYRVLRDDLPAANGITMDPAGRRLFVDEFRPGGRLMELDPFGQGEPKFFMEDLNGPNAPAIGPDGRLYFPLVFANEIWVYDIDAGRGQLLFDDVSVPTAVKFDGRGRLVTSESGAGCITAIDLETGAREKLADVPKGIDNVSVGPDDRIFVSHYVDGRVAEETGNAHRILSPSGLLGPHGLALGPGGRLLVADGLSVAAVDGGAITRLFTLLIELHTLAAGVAPLGDDLAVLAVTGEVLLYRQGSTEPSVLYEGLVDPTSIRADTDNSVLVVERGAGQVSHIDRSGGHHAVLHGLDHPGAMDRGDDGRLYVSQGTTVAAFEHNGTHRATIDGFTDAQGVAVAGTTLLVADAGAHQLVAVDTASGARQVVVHDAPIGQPVTGVVPAAFCSVCADGEGGFYVGANGDGSIRRLRRA
jgi:sugar lactone lactonase YvrE